MLLEQIAEGFIGQLLQNLHGVARQQLQRLQVVGSNSMSLRGPLSSRTAVPVTRAGRVGFLAAGFFAIASVSRNTLD
jgi:hypothetical protein